MNIRKYREAAQLSKTELAKKMGVSVPTVSRWEKGEDFPAAARLPALASALDCAIDELYDRENGTAREKAPMQTGAQGRKGGTPMKIELSQARLDETIAALEALIPRLELEAAAFAQVNPREGTALAGERLGQAAKMRRLCEWYMNL